MKHGFLKVAVATPRLRVADPTFNACELGRIAKDAHASGVRVLVFPELSLTGYTCGDLFYSETLIRGAQAALKDYLFDTKHLDLLTVVGLPLVWRGKLCNAAAVCKSGRLLGVVPKTHLPAMGETNEARYFTAPDTAVQDECCFDGKTVPFASRLLFVAEELPALRLAVELGGESGLSLAPSLSHTAAGATLVCNPAASAEFVGSESHRRDTVRALAARTLSGYLYAGAGEGESTTDVVFGGHAMICEGNDLLAEKLPFDTTADWIASEIDLERLSYERRRNNLWESAQEGYREIGFSLPLVDTILTRPVAASPFLPDDKKERQNRCNTILAIQTAGLKARIERAYAKKLVLGISGGLDSTLALLVMVRAMDALKRDRKDIIAVTMPCFGTTKRTKSNATVLCEELGVDFRCVDIFDAVNLHFRDIGHDPKDHNVTYENSQARERTQILMDIANDCGGMVIGTGDLSELALGWATYNGDHMSMYGVNASVPKTLVRHIVSHCADLYESEGAQKIANALRDVLNTPVSPELLPADEKGEIAQKTEDLVGPYEIHDFYLYYMLRYGFSPSKLYRLAKHALGKSYDEETLRKWLKIFVRRFFSQQFKRSCAPDGPKVGSVGLSPRGAWLMPSDASSALWLKEIDKL